MSLTFSFTHAGTTTAQHLTLADTARVAGYLASVNGGAEAYFAAILARLVQEANEWAATQAAQTAAAAVSVQHPAWAAGLWMAPGTRWIHAGGTYEVVQGHRSQAGWKPPQVPALFRVVQAAPPVGDPPWVAGELVAVNVRRVHLGITYRAVQQHTTQVGWEPPHVPALWAVVT